MCKHTIRVLVLVLVFSFAGGSLCSAAPRDDGAAAARIEARAVHEQHQRLTGVGGVIESRLEALLRWVRQVFGDGPKISANGLTDDPDPTTDELLPGGPDPEEGTGGTPGNNQEDEELDDETGPFKPAARKS